MNNNFYKQGVVWGGYPVKKEAPDYLVSRYIKMFINRFRSYQLSNKFIQSSFLSSTQEYQKNQSFDGLWPVHAKNIQGKITTKQGLVEACSFLRVFLEREKKVILTDKQFLAIWTLNHQFFIHDYVGVNKKYAVFFAACIEYWKGHKVHLAMASDKLAVSEYENMQDCYHSLGIEVAIVTSTMSFNERQKAYQAQIVYIGAQQLARDALIDLDNLKAQSTSAGFFLDKLGTESVHSEMLLSGLCSVIINDANLILLELAAQPVLLEQETVNNELYTVLMLAIATAKKLVANEDFIIDQSRAEYQLTKSGKEKIQGSTIKFNEFWRSEKRANSIIRDALIVLQEYKNEQHYTVQEQKIRILKESQYALNVELKSLEILIGIKEELAEPVQRIVKSQISYQYFFSHYFRVMGFTYCGNEIKRELQQVYNFSSYTLNKEQKTSFELYCLQDKSEKLDKLRQLVEDKVVNGWDDPRMPTVSGLRRRGYTPSALKKFCDMVPVSSKNNSDIDVAILERAVRDDLNESASRAMCVMNPLKVTITNMPDNNAGGADELLLAAAHPNKPELGERKLPFTSTLYIDKSDFTEEQGLSRKKFKQLVLNEYVRLRGAYIIKAEESIKNDAGEIVEVRATLVADSVGNNVEGIKPRGVIHWVSAEQSVDAEIRLYDRLFNHPNPDSGDEDFMAHINPENFSVIHARLEPDAALAKPEQVFQFEREGYFVADRYDHNHEAGKIIFNRTIGLKDSWSNK